MTPEDIIKYFPTEDEVAKYCREPKHPFTEQMGQISCFQWGVKWAKEELISNLKNSNGTTTGRPK